MSLTTAILIVVGFIVVAYIINWLMGLFRRKVVYGEGWTGRLEKFDYSADVEQSRSYTHMYPSRADSALQNIYRNVKDLGLSDSPHHLVRAYVEWEETNDEGETETYSQELSSGDILQVMRGERSSSSFALGYGDVKVYVAVPSLVEKLEMLFSTSAGPRRAIYTRRVPLDESKVERLLEELSKKLTIGAKYTKKPEQEFIDDLYGDRFTSVRYKKG